MALEKNYYELIYSFEGETAGLVIEALDVVQRGYILRAFYHEEKDFSRIRKYMTPKEMAEAMFGMNTPGYILNILNSFPRETKSSVVAELTKLAIQRVESIDKNPRSTDSCLAFVCDGVLAFLPESARRCNDPTCPFGEYEKAGCILLSDDLEHSTHIPCVKISP